MANANSRLAVEIPKSLLGKPNLIQHYKITMAVSRHGKSEPAVHPDGWKEDEQELVDMFFGEKVLLASANN